MTQNQNVTVVDVTLRDGNHTVRHQFTPELVAKTAAALDAAGVEIIEVGHGDGLAGSSIHVGRAAATDREWIKAAVAAVRNAKVGVFVVPGFGTKPDLEAAAELGVKVARIGIHCTEADVTEQHIKLSRDLGLYTVGYLVSSGMATPERVAEEAAKMESYGAQYINLAESQGHLVPTQVAKLIETVRRRIDIPVGFHAHNNLGCGIGNSLAAIEAGAAFVDGSLKGFGGGAGNAQTEVLVAALKRAGVEVSPDLFGIMDAATEFANALPPDTKMPRIDNDSIIMGYANVYGGYVLKIKQAAERYGCDARELVLRLGERQVVAMQEDVVTEEALRLAKQKAAAA
ncbi:4-hyroxy-2-oxovalerate/4-hydroxy-2-oxopentanoic acid aldolase, class I [Stutzerimonas xanthomarina]|nr:4-hyroxy-2-oxovalerate/4-hydroxy-2-oxopentanoic acid aldolase, class I [Stutzerimonas xanthomarina]